MRELARIIFSVQFCRNTLGSWSQSGLENIFFIAKQRAEIFAGDLINAEVWPQKPRSNFEERFFAISYRNDKSPHRYLWIMTPTPSRKPPRPSPQTV